MSDVTNIFMFEIGVDDKDVARLKNFHHAVNDAGGNAQRSLKESIKNDAFPDDALGLDHLKAIHSIFSGDHGHDYDTPVAFPAWPGRNLYVFKLDIIISDHEHREKHGRTQFGPQIAPLSQVMVPGWPKACFLEDTTLHGVERSNVVEFKENNIPKTADELPEKANWASFVFDLNDNFRKSDFITAVLDQHSTINTSKKMELRVAFNLMNSRSKMPPWITPTIAVQADHGQVHPLLLTAKFLLDLSEQP